MSQENSTTTSSNKSVGDREHSTGGIGGTSLLSSQTEDSFLYGSKAKSPANSIISSGSLNRSQASFISSTTSEARNLNMHLLQGATDRSWIDPWEMTPSAKFYQKNYQSPTRQLVATSILTNSNNNISINNSPNDGNNVQMVPQNGSGPMLLNSGASGIYSINEDDPNNPNPLKSPLLLDGDDNEDQQQEVKEASLTNKFGPWDGVMTGALLNIWGVILFVKLGWVIGQAGIIQTILIILLSTVVTTLTTISMSAICTNGTVLAGGAYYIISRTIGPAFGGAVGMILSIGSMIAVSLYLIGFAQALQINLADQITLKNGDSFHIFNDPTNDIRLYSTVFLIICLILAIVGLKYVIKAQIGLLVWILISVTTLMAGTFYRTSEDPKLYGVFKGLSTEHGYLSPHDGAMHSNFWHNLGSHYTCICTVDSQGNNICNPPVGDNKGCTTYTFWTVLAIFFPAVTGIMAGANLSGDLRNPSKDIPKGTFTAIGLSSTVYIILVILIGATTKRDALLANSLIMTNICVWDYIIYIATYAATVSSAIASLGISYFSLFSVDIKYETQNIISRCTENIASCW